MNGVRHSRDTHPNAVRGFANTPDFRLLLFRALPFRS
jgi:hypothetical protein